MLAGAASDRALDCPGTRLASPQRHCESVSRQDEGNYGQSLRRVPVPRCFRRIAIRFRSRVIASECIRTDALDALHGLAAAALRGYAAPGGKIIGKDHG